LECAPQAFRGGLALGVLLLRKVCGALGAPDRHAGARRRVTAGVMHAGSSSPPDPRGKWSVARLPASEPTNLVVYHASTLIREPQPTPPAQTGVLATPSHACGRDGLGWLLVGVRCAVRRSWGVATRWCACQSAAPGVFWSPAITLTALGLAAQWRFGLAALLRGRPLEAVS
jgi:hypothetical protein